MTLNEIFNRFGKTAPPQLLHSSGGDWRVSQPERRAGDNHQPAVPFEAEIVAQRMGKEVPFLEMVLLCL